MLYIARYTGCPNTVRRAAISNVLVEWAEPTITSQVARGLSSSHLRQANGQMPKSANLTLVGQRSLSPPALLPLGTTTVVYSTNVTGGTIVCTFAVVVSSGLETVSSVPGHRFVPAAGTSSALVIDTFADDSALYSACCSSQPCYN